MKLNFKQCILTAATVFAVMQASAAPLYDNGTASGHNGFGIWGAVEGDAGTTADDFVLASGASIGSVGFYFNNYSGTSGWDGKISYAILSSAGGMPGTILATGEGRNVTQLAGDYAWCCGNQNSTLVEFDLQTSFAASANTTYWLRLGGAGGPSPWWVSSSSSGNAITSGSSMNYALAFYLNAAQAAPSDVPEPASLALLGLGLAALGARRKTKQD